MALDVGTKTIGVAVSDPLGMFAQPVETIARTGRRADVGRVAELCDQYAPVRVVVGLPIGTDGSEMSSAKEARRMAKAVAGVVSGEVVLLDERFTTAQAERVLIAGGMRRKKRKKVIDQAAAVLILQQWLDGPFGGEVVEPEPPTGAGTEEGS
ncbi:MAG: Holliday junction resolvase RuvX [Deltaproteobacteria bacterium]|nr:Holliday junction resolvase RuvX [Deltaproteobacteria bacterium]